MKKHILIFAASCIIIGFFSACEKAKQCEKIETDIIIDECQSTLENTNWKLVGFVDIETGCLKKAEPTDCNSCYTLNFKADSILFGHTSTNSFNAAYIVDYDMNSIQIKVLLSTTVGEMGDGYLYDSILDKVQFFILQMDELRLYYNDKNNYLLFKLKQ
jgi:hypothetical protein